MELVVLQQGTHGRHTKHSCIGCQKPSTGALECRLVISSICVCMRHASRCVNRSEAKEASGALREAQEHSRDLQAEVGIHSPTRLQARHRCQPGSELCAYKIQLLRLRLYNPAKAFLYRGWVRPDVELSPPCFCPAQQTIHAGPMPRGRPN